MSALRWETHGRQWPNRAASRFVETPRLVWHVQVMGDGPALLLLHGTGAATHSWRDVMPLLARDFTVIAPDLPGHGFTKGRPAGGLTLKGMARALADLLAALGQTPVLIAGHSAGAAIALQTVRDSALTVPVVGFNPALMPFPGLAARIFPQLARMLFINPFVPRIFAATARRAGEPQKFLGKATGSQIDAAGIAHYATLLGNHHHCGGALEMMANWDLEALGAMLPDVPNPVLLVHSRGDSAVPLASVEKAARIMPNCTLEVLPELGHLSHEERPETAAALIRDFAERPEQTRGAA